MLPKLDLAEPDKSPTASRCKNFPTSQRLEKDEHGASAGQFLLWQVLLTVVFQVLVVVVLKALGGVGVS